MHIFFLVFHGFCAHTKVTDLPPAPSEDGSPCLRILTLRLCNNDVSDVRVREHGRVCVGMFVWCLLCPGLAGSAADGRVLVGLIRLSCLGRLALWIQMVTELGVSGWVGALRPVGI